MHNKRLDQSVYPKDWAQRGRLYVRMNSWNCPEALETRSQIAVNGITISQHVKIDADSLNPPVDLNLDI